jgi:enoyl-CoA hydratase/carnithine racemase
VSEPILLDVDDPIAVLTLNRPDERNTMSAEVLDTFKARIAEVGDMPDVRCLVITGSGRYFCSGANLTGMGSLLGTDSPDGEEGIRKNITGVYESFLCLLDVDVPVIAAINGHAVGGGFGLALACDIRVANLAAKMGANFVRLGLHPGMATTYMMPRLLGVSKAAELLFTGRIFTGEEAAEMGLVSYAVAAEEVVPKAMALAKEIASAAPIAVRLAKQSLYQSIDYDPRSWIEPEATAQAKTVKTRDFMEGVGAFLQKRKPIFKGR